MNIQRKASSPFRESFVWMIKMRRQSYINLAREWQYFPGKLLTPEMLKKDPGYYSCYISIGERNEMETGE